ncbi:MAG: helix-turn-helix domain-containing protein [Micromonosporaceae bacterium]
MSADTPEKVLGESLRSLRTARGMSQEDVAQMMALAGFSWHQTTVAKTESGSRPVRVNEAAALAAQFGVWVDDLIFARCGVPRVHQSPRTETSAERFRRLHDEARNADGDDD